MRKFLLLIPVLVVQSCQSAGGDATEVQEIPVEASATMGNEALDSLNEIIRYAPNDMNALEARAGMYLRQQNLKYAAADVAATLIANAVTVESDQIKRAPASEIDLDSDLGDRLVTVDVGHLSDNDAATALTHGQRLADSLCASGLIVAAYGRLGDRGFVVGQQACDG